MKRYRLYTQDLHRGDIHAIVGDTFRGYTVYEATGVWRGNLEKTLVIEILTDLDKELIDEIAEGIKIRNHQESVLITSEDIDAEFI